MSIEIKSDILAKELNQGIVPLGVPKAYQYDAALVEAARAAVNQGIDDVAEAGDTAKAAVEAQGTASVNAVSAQEQASKADVNALGDKILAQMKHGYGYPFTAATAAAMTDTAKIYVYTGAETGYTNGNWYYWNGTAWVSGGVYNATALETDKTLSVSGAAADAYTVGNYVSISKKRSVFVDVLDSAPRSNRYYNPVDMEFKSSSQYTAYVIPVTNTDHFKYSGSGNKYAPGIVFFGGEPSSDTYVSTWGSWGDTSSSYSNADIFIPVGVSYVVVQGPTGTMQFSHDVINSSFFDQLINSNWVNENKTYTLGYFNPVSKIFSTVGNIYYSRYDVNDVESLMVLSHGNNEYAPAVVFFSGEPSAETYLSFAGTTSYFYDTVSVPSNASIALVQFNDHRIHGVWLKNYGESLQNNNFKFYFDTNENLCVESRYNNNGNIIVKIGKWGVNNIPDFLQMYAPGASLSTVISDWHSPYIVKDNSKNAPNLLFTGGGHDYNGNRTAENEYFNIYVDGLLIDSTMSGYGKKLHLVWSNLVQACNTVKSDGSGANVLREIITMDFDGIEWKTHTQIQALTDITILTWYGFQIVSTNSKYWNNVHYIGGGNRTPTSGALSSNSDGMCDAIEAFSENHRVVCEINKNIDLGAGTHGNNNFAFNASYGKAYFFPAKDFVLLNEEVADCEAVYHFESNV